MLPKSLKKLKRLRFNHGSIFGYWDKHFLRRLYIVVAVLSRYSYDDI